MIYEGDELLRIHNLLIEIIERVAMPAEKQLELHIGCITDELALDFCEIGMSYIRLLYDNKITEALIESFVPARFCLDLDIEEFYDFKVILIESENQARIIYSKNNIVNDLYVEKGYVDRIIYQAYKELNCIYDSFEQSVYR